MYFIAWREGAIYYFININPPFLFGEDLCFVPSKDLYLIKLFSLV